MPSDSVHRMRRSKSAPSVRRRHAAASVYEPLDPVTARHHATKAASVAMTQAKSKSHASYGDRKARSEDVTPAPATAPIRRSSSIRFAQEAGLPNRHNTTASHNPLKVPRETKASTEQQLPADTYTVDEFQGFGNEDIFAPSSYRRLRKAKSMFSTKSMRNSRGSETPPSTEPSYTDYSLRQKSTETAPDTHRSLRHSLSFFNGTSQTIRRAKSQHTMGVRSRVSEEGDYPIPKSHPSQHSREGRLAQKSLRPAPRAMRELSPDEDVVPVPNGLQKKARAFSFSIKKRLKRVFGRPSSVEDDLSEEPDFRSPYQNNTIFESRPTVGGTSPPMLHSKQSFESIATSASRVTSWTNSTAGNTVKAKSNPGRNHLSTITEGGDSFVGQHFGVPEMHGPKQDEYQQRKQIDSQRVYSALMRHIGEAASKDGERVISSGTVKGYPVITERSSSVQSQRESRSIRQMASDMSMKTARTSLPVDSRPESPQSHSSYSRYQETNRPGVPTKTFMHSGLPSKKSSSSLREPESPFFPSSASMKPKTPSPYKVAMNSIRESEDSDNDAASVIVKTAANTRRISTSPSIYSRTPSGCAASREDLQHEVKGPMQSGMATIFDSQVPYRSPKKNVSPAANLRSKNSAEWKKWMDSQISNIAIFDAPRLSSPSDTRKHRRENAECGEEPLRIGVGTGSHNPAYTETLRPKSSLSGLQNFNESREFRLPTPIAERKLSGQSNFSRPLSRQSVGSFKAVDRPLVDGNTITRLYEDLNRVKLSNRQDTGEGSAEKPARSPWSIDILNSSNRRLAIKTAREARLSRSPGGLSTIRQIDDSKDVKDIQFRSIRGGSPYSTCNRENETSPAIHKKDQTGVETSSLSNMPKPTYSKNIVDHFLHARRVQEDTTEHDDALAFI